MRADLEGRIVCLGDDCAPVEISIVSAADVGNAAKTKKKLSEAASTIDAAEVRTRAMARQLKGVESLPEAQAQALLPGTLETDPEEEDGAASG